MTASDHTFEIIAGIPSYNEADNIAFVTRVVDEGLIRYFNEYRCCIVNVDNNSEDNTKGAFLGTETVNPKRYISTPPGIRGKGNNFYNLFKFCGSQKPALKAVVVVDADLKSITPQWIKHLCDPILKGYDFSLPKYSRHQFDGTITNHICFPLIFGLLGHDIRQPIGGEFSFSPPLMDHWLGLKWHPTTRQYGIDIFMTLNALSGDFKICEVGLGAKIHKASAPKLGPMFTQVVTTFFDFITSNHNLWIKAPVLRPKPKPSFGIAKLDPPQELQIDIRKLKDQLREEFEPRKKLLRRFLNQYAVSRLDEMFRQDYYSIDILLWTQVVYQLLFAFDRGSKKIKEDIVEAIKPLYFGRSVTFDYTTWKYNIKYAETAVREQALAFASQKPYFIGLYHAV